MAIYSDISGTPNRVLVLDERAVAQALENLLATRKGERLFLPDYGIDLEQLLFEPMDEETAFAIKSEVIRSVEQWEPRVVVDYAATTVTPNYEENKYEITLVYSIAGLEEDRWEWTGELQIIR